VSSAQCQDPSRSAPAKRLLHTRGSVLWGRQWLPVEAPCCPTCCLRVLLSGSVSFPLSRASAGPLDSRGGRHSDALCAALQGGQLVHHCAEVRPQEVRQPAACPPLPQDFLRAFPCEHQWQGDSSHLTLGLALLKWNEASALSAASPRVLVFRAQGVGQELPSAVGEAPEPDSEHGPPHRGGAGARDPDAAAVRQRVGLIVAVHARGGRTTPSRTSGTPSASAWSAAATPPTLSASALAPDRPRPASSSRGRPPPTPGRGCARPRRQRPAPGRPQVRRS